MLQSNWVDVVLDGLPRDFVVLGTECQHIRLKMRDGDAPALERTASLGPGKRVRLCETGICLRSEEQTRVELIGLDWVGCVGLCIIRLEMLRRLSNFCLHVCSQPGGHVET